MTPQHFVDCEDVGCLEVDDVVFFTEGSRKAHLETLQRVQYLDHAKEVIQTNVFGPIA